MPGFLQELRDAIETSDNQALIPLAELVANDLQPSDLGDAEFGELVLLLESVVRRGQSREVTEPVLSALIYLSCEPRFSADARARLEAVLRDGSQAILVHAIVEASTYGDQSWIPFVRPFFGDERATVALAAEGTLRDLGEIDDHRARLHARDAKESHRAKLAALANGRVFVGEAEGPTRVRTRAEALVGIDSEGPGESNERS